MSAVYDCLYMGIYRNARKDNHLMWPFNLELVTISILLLTPNQASHSLLSFSISRILEKKMFLFIYQFQENNNYSFDNYTRTFHLLFNLL